MEERMHLLMAKTLNNEATGEERRELNDWLDVSAENRAAFDAVKGLWQKADTVLQQPQFDVDAAWKKVEARTIALQESEAGPMVEQHTTLRPMQKWWAIGGVAAGLIIIALAYNFLRGPDMVSASATDHMLAVTLPDQSTVNLTPGSTIRYPESFEGKRREISLEGEGFFEVTRNEEKPFIINAQSAEVKVLGTSFNVSCTDSTATVSVCTGKVQMSEAEHPEQKIVLTRGTKGVFENKKLTTNVDTNYTYYRTGTLELNDRTLEQAITLIGKVKNATIVFDNSMSAASRSQKINFTLKKESTLKQVLDELCLITNTKWKFVNNRYVIYPK